MEPLTAVKLSVSMARNQGSPDIKIIHISSLIANADASSTPTDTLSPLIDNCACVSVVGVRDKAYVQGFLKPTGTRASADSIEYAKPKSVLNLTFCTRLPTMTSSRGVHRVHDHGYDPLNL